MRKSDQVQTRRIPISAARFPPTPSWQANNGRALVTFALEADGLRHAYGTTTALDNVSVRVATGGLLAVVGESGSGKSTLLRAFNRMIDPDHGSVRVEGDDVTSMSAVTLRRRIGYVPQNGGLMPHWRVLRNVALVPQLNNVTDSLQSARTALQLVGLPDETFGRRFPHELSGGQRQRVSIARALAAHQRIVLLDEPFGALDAISRSELHDAFAELRTTLSFTAVLITHDLAEAALLADSIAVMRAGRIEQHGAFDELCNAPATPYVATLIHHALNAARSLGAR